MDRKETEGAPPPRRPVPAAEESTKEPVKGPAEAPATKRFTDWAAI